MQWFYKVFCEDFQTPLISIFKSVFDKSELSNFQCLKTARAKKYRPFLILLNEITYVEGRFISKSGRLFLVILQVTDFLNLSVLVVTADI